MKRWLSLLSEAIRGSDRDYTAGPVGPSLVMLAVPMVLEMAMESLFAVVDVFYASRVSADAIATIGVTESMLTIRLSSVITPCGGNGTTFSRMSML